MQVSRQNQTFSFLTAIQLHSGDDLIYTRRGDNISGKAVMDETRHRAENTMNELVFHLDSGTTFPWDM